MPTYEYECTNCGYVFEMVQRMSARPKTKPDEPCPGCGKMAPIQRLIGTGGAVIFKGSGFYETDYRSENYKKAARAERKKPAEPSSETSSGKKAASPSNTSDKKAGKTTSPSK